MYRVGDIYRIGDMHRLVEGCIVYMHTTIDADTCTDVLTEALDPVCRLAPKK